MSLWYDGKEDGFLNALSFKLGFKEDEKLLTAIKQMKACSDVALTLNIKPKINYENLNEVADILLSKGIEVNFECMAIPLLQRAIGLGNIILVEKFLKYNADANAISSCGTDAMTIAILYKQPASVKLLIGYGGDCAVRNQQGSLDILSYPALTNLYSIDPTLEDFIKQKCLPGSLEQDEYDL